MNMNGRPRAKATIQALKRLKRYKSPTKQQIKAVADAHGVHWTTLYRASRSKNA